MATARPSAVSMSASEMPADTAERPPEPAAAIPNLTSGAGGIGATNTDEDWVLAIRHGVGHDGRGLILMPSRVWYYLSDEDLADLIAYLKSLPPVDNELPNSELGPLGRVMLTLGQLPEMLLPNVTMIDHYAPRPVAPQP